MTLARTNRGTFAEGNAGGPGRPRRETERQYVAAIAEACPVDVWRSIVERAVTDAQAGDSAARAWLSFYLVGKPRHDASSLHALAVEEAAGVDWVDLDAEQEKQRALFASIGLAGGG